jgi:hypothetical protein
VAEVGDPRGLQARHLQSYNRDRVSYITVLSIKI